MFASADSDALDIGAKTRELGGRGFLTLRAQAVGSRMGLLATAPQSFDTVPDRARRCADFIAILLAVLLSGHRRTSLGSRTGQINDAGPGPPDVNHANDRRQHRGAREQARQPRWPHRGARRREPHHHDGEP